MSSVDLIQHWTAALLTPDQSRPFRIAAVIVAVLLVWRAIVLAAQYSPPPPPPRPAPPIVESQAPVPPRAPSSWSLWRSKKERMAESAAVAHSEADMLRAKRDAAIAAAELRDTLVELRPRPAERAPKERHPPGLTLREIQALLVLANLPPDIHARLSQLFRDAIADRS